MEGGEGHRHSAYARIFSEHANERTGKIREDPNRDDANSSFFLKKSFFRICFFPDDDSWNLLHGRESERERGESLNYVVNEGNSKGEKLFV